MLNQPLPLSPALLARYRIRARRQLRPGLQGGHLMRRKGQSLEFRDFHHYALGDDIRHVDWRASSRIGGPDDWLVRRFTAEESLTLAISIDRGASMFLPAPLPKILIARWIAEAVATIALQSGDRVILHGQAGGGGPAKTLSGMARAGLLRATLDAIIGTAPKDTRRQAPSLGRVLPPASVWLIVSDGYGEGADGDWPLARAMNQAQEGQRWVIFLELDSWPMEKRLLGLGSRRIEGPGGLADHNRFHIGREEIALVEENLQRHSLSFRQRVRRGAIDFTTWRWPDREEVDAAAFFTHQFLNETLLARLFMKDAA